MEIRKAGRRLLDVVTRDGLGAGLGAVTRGMRGPVEGLLDFASSGTLAGRDATGSVRVGPGGFALDKAAEPNGVRWGLRGGFGLAPTGDAVPGDAKPGAWGMATFGLGSNPTIPRSNPEQLGDWGTREALASWDLAAGERARSSVGAAAAPHETQQAEPPSARDEMERVVREVREREKNPYWYRP